MINEEMYNYNNIDMTNINMDMNQNLSCEEQSAYQCTPIVESPIEKCVHREIIHKVNHVCPIHTKIINHHIYKHCYTPQYTCCEENQVVNIDEGSCCNYR